MTPKLHRTAAYGALHNTADTLRAILTRANSSDHALELSTATKTKISEALQALYQAQREMESEDIVASVADMHVPCPKCFLAQCTGDCRA